MLIKPAYAQAAGGEPSFLISLLPLILIFVVFWFLLIRPQQKRMREHKEMIAALKKGDKVLTAGGIYGTVTRVVDDTSLEVEIATGVRVRVARGTITENVSGSTVQVPKPANADKAQPTEKPARGGRRGKAAEASEPEPVAEAPVDANAEAEAAKPDAGKGAAS